MLAIGFAIFGIRTANAIESASNWIEEHESSMNSKRIAIWVVASAAGVAIVATLWLQTQHWRPRSVTIQGAVIRRDDDTRKEQPVAGAVVAVSDGVSSSSTQSDASGYFKLTLRTGVWPGETLDLSFRHPDYRPLNLEVQISLRPVASKLYIAALDPMSVPSTTASGAPPSVISTIRVRYTVNLPAETNIGSAVKTFQVVNRGNIPCKRQYPCSPDRTWKAAMSSASMDAGLGNEFRNARASCIAGPCPFTRIDIGGFTSGSRSITATALDWSDTATFLLEAEVFRDSIDSSVRESYPVIYGRTLYFTVPTTQEGVSIEAEMDGTPMVFPLGLNLYLSWATCIARSSLNGDGSTVYQCRLKPGYRF
jgi:hypothetical protein